MTHQFDVEQARELGLFEAVFLEHLKFWLRKNKANGVNSHDGRTWTYNSRAAYAKLFPYWSQSQIKRISTSLVAKGVIRTGNYNPNAHDRTLWYALEDEAGLALDQTIPPSPSDDSDTSSCRDRKMSIAGLRTSSEDQGSAASAADTPPFEAIIGYLNEAVGKQFSHRGEDHRRRIRAVWKKLPGLGSRSTEGRLKLIQLVIDVKAEQWLGNPEMAHNLRPSTLFRSFDRFEQYLNENPKYVAWARGRART